MASVPALSVRQPWAWAIVAGGKDVENRSWYTNYRGPVRIHAGLRFDAAGVDAIARLGVSVPPRAELVFGAIIGRVDLVDVVDDSRSEWAVPGVYHFVLARPRPFARPRPCRGRLGFFTP